MYNGTKIKLDTFDKISKFTSVAASFNSDIDISRGNYAVDGKSALGILSFDLRTPLNVVINSDNEEEIRRFNKAMVEFE